MFLYLPLLYMGDIPLVVLSIHLLITYPQNQKNKKSDAPSLNNESVFIFPWRVFLIFHCQDMLCNVGWIKPQASFALKFTDSLPRDQGFPCMVLLGLP